MPASETERNELTATHLVLGSLISVPIVAGLSAGVSVVSGCIGKYAFSFVDPAFVSGVGGLWSMAGMGALAGLFQVIPNIIINHLFDNSPICKAYPNLSNFLQTSLLFAVQAAAVAASAAIVGSPILPTMACILLIDAILWVIKNLCNVVNALVQCNANSDAAPAPAC